MGTPCRVAKEVDIPTGTDCGGTTPVDRAVLQCAVRAVADAILLWNASQRKSMCLRSKRATLSPLVSCARHSSRQCLQAWCFTGLRVTALKRLLGEAGGFWELDSGHWSFQHFLKGCYFFLSSMGRTLNSLKVYIALCIHILNKTKSLLDLFSSLSVAYDKYCTFFALAKMVSDVRKIPAN